MIKYIALALILALTACGHKDSPVAPTDPGVAYRAPGIMITPVDGGSALAKSMVSADPGIFLGTFKKSRVVLFNIQNTGSVPLTGLKITSTNPNFTVTPDSIPVLGIPGDSGAVPLVPILQVWVGHGTTGLATSPEPLLWDGVSIGEQTTTADIQFSWDPDTSENADTSAPTSTTYSMTAQAEVAAIGPGYVVAGSCDIRVIPDSVLYSPGDTVPNCTVANSCSFWIPQGCVHGRGIRQESSNVFTLNTDHSF